MVSNKKKYAIWNTRISNKNNSTFSKVGNSINIDKRLSDEDIFGSIAHVEMLYKQKILPLKIKNKIVWGLLKIKNEIKKNKFIFEEKYEDIHMNIEKRLEEIIGEDAGFIHTARSRNDQVITDLKIWIKKASKKIIHNLENSSKLILKISERNIFTIMPSFTHLKNAQPISFAHYLLAYIEMFNRDISRFKSNFKSLEENPLGVGAISGTSFKIDRNITSKKLGFKFPTKNSIDTVSDRDFVLDFLYAVSVCSTHISRFAEDFIIWNSDAYQIINLNDKIVTGSSIMPQKKNPDPLEYLRGKTGSIQGNLFSMLSILKGLPLSYFKDLQDDKELTFKSYDLIVNSILILNDVLKNFSPNKKRMYELAQVGYITATDLADYMVLKFNYPFRKAYKITSKIVNYCEKNKINFEKVRIDDLKKIDSNLTLDTLKVLNLENSIKSKISYGGTSFENIKKMITRYKRELK